MDRARWFWRTDWNFKSGTYANVANLVRSRDLHLFNTRVGVSKDAVSLELFVNNLFNNHTITGIYDNWTIDPNAFHFSAYSALHVALPELRTMGAQVRVKF
jgi:iron complex outermembrane receptor protein